MISAMRCPNGSVPQVTTGPRRSAMDEERHDPEACEPDRDTSGQEQAAQPTEACRAPRAVRSRDHAEQQRDREHDREDHHRDQVRDRERQRTRPQR